MRRSPPGSMPPASSTTCSRTCACRTSSSRTGNAADVRFREPGLLLALALLPLAIAAYVMAQRRRRRYAVRYTNVDVLASLAGRSWGRHVPAALTLLALTALLIALGR